MGRQPLQICIHIPFCPPASLPGGRRALMADAATAHAYAMALLREIEATAPDFSDSEVSSISFTGPAPTTLSPEDLIAIAKTLRERFFVSPDAEVSLSVLPNQIEARWMVHLQKVGISRLSLDLIACHSRDAARLKIPATLGSMETSLVLPQVFHLKSYEACLSYGLPGQTVQSFRTSLRFAVRYNTPEITLTKAGEPDAAIVREQEAYIREHLTEKGYAEYRPGRWAKPGHESKQLLAAESGSDILSFGIGTTSRTDGVYYKTTTDIRTYVQHAEDPEKIYTVLGAC